MLGIASLSPLTSPEASPAPEEVTPTPTPAPVPAVPASTPILVHGVHDCSASDQRLAASLHELEVLRSASKAKEAEFNVQVTDLELQVRSLTNELTRTKEEAGSLKSRLDLTTMDLKNTTKSLAGLRAWTTTEDDDGSGPYYDPSNVQNSDPRKR